MRGKILSKCLFLLLLLLVLHLTAEGGEEDLFSKIKISSIKGDKKAPDVEPEKTVEARAADDDLRRQFHRLNCQRAAFLRKNGVFAFRDGICLAIHFGAVIAVVAELLDHRVLRLRFG